MPLRRRKAFHSGRRDVRPENLCACSAGPSLRCYSPRKNRCSQLRRGLGRSMYSPRMTSRPPNRPPLSVTCSTPDGISGGKGLRLGSAGCAPAGVVSLSGSLGIWTPILEHGQECCVEDREDQRGDRDQQSYDLRSQWSLVGLVDLDEVREQSRAGLLAGELGCLDLGVELLRFGSDVEARDGQYGAGDQDRDGESGDRDPVVRSERFVRRERDRDQPGVEPDQADRLAIDVLCSNSGQDVYAE
jgi:hypothetical protein